MSLVEGSERPGQLRVPMDRGPNFSPELWQKESRSPGACSPWGWLPVSDLASAQVTTSCCCGYTGTVVTADGVAGPWQSRWYPECPLLLGVVLACPTGDMGKRPHGSFFLGGGGLCPEWRKREPVVQFTSEPGLPP